MKEIKVFPARMLTDAEMNPPVQARKLIEILEGAGFSADCAEPELIYSGRRLMRGMQQQFAQGEAWCRLAWVPLTAEADAKKPSFSPIELFDFMSEGPESTLLVELHRESFYWLEFQKSVRHALVSFERWYESEDVTWIIRVDLCWPHHDLWLKQSTGSHR